MSKPKGELVTIYPDHGPERHFLLGVPAVEQSLPVDEAEALVATGAFTYDPPPAESAPEPGPAADDKE